MNILYLIGNGLDLAQGMKTRYSDFYDKYSKPLEQAINPAALKLRSEISKDYQTWADLELSLGTYTSQVKNEDIDAVYYDISDTLREYLNEEQEKYKPTDNVRELAINDLISPYETLLPKDKEEITNYIINLKNSNGPSATTSMNIISFNYTNTLEKLLSEFIGKFIGQILRTNVILKDIIHIHGTLDSHMILGVNDIEQITNEQFKQDSSIRDMLVKPESNSAIRSNNDTICQRLIESADIIIIFGMSLGATDKIWWEKIGNQVLEGTQLIIFEHLNQPLDYKRAHKLGSMRNNVIKKFTSHLNSHYLDIATIHQNTYINFSTDFLSNNKGI